MKLVIYNGSPRSKKSLVFIVQSGFPEAIHSVCIEKYLKKFTSKLNCTYLGTVIKGGVEEIQVILFKKNFISDIIFYRGNKFLLG